MDVSSMFRCLVTLWILALSFTSARAWLSPHYYSLSCPNLLYIVRSAVKEAVAKEPRMGASLLRLHFHDCFVQGCDASILLDGSASEKLAAPNTRSVRGFEVIDDIKSKVEAACSGVVSCADILALAARDSVAELGGPEWIVPLGRRDSKNANAPLANITVPAPTLNLANLTQSFQNQGLSVQEMVALSGSHTIGQARCTSFRGHIYNDTNIDTSYAKSLQANCPSQTNSEDDNLAPLDFTPTLFNNDYFKNLVENKGLLHSDQELFNGVSTDSMVKTYAEDMYLFFIDFAAAMVKLGNINALTDTAGEIRLNCRVAN